MDRRPVHFIGLQLISTGVLYVGLPTPLSCVVRQKWSVGPPQAMAVGLGPWKPLPGGILPLLFRKLMSGL